MKTILKGSIIFCALLLPFVSLAQLNIPRPSPLGKISQEVGLNEISIEYSRPSAKERVIFGDLVPYGKLWRTGANAATKITLKDDAKFNNVAIPKGEYSLFTIPRQNDWTIIINKDVNAGVDSYDEAKDQARFVVTPQKTTEKVETFTIKIANVKMDEADIVLAWENTKVSFKMTTDVDAKVMKQIEQATKGVDPMVYYRAAVYYYDTGKDLNQALTWVNKSLEDKQTFWMLHSKAKIQAKMGDTKGAIETAKKSKELAVKENNEDYIALNDKAIAEWSKKK